MDNQPIERKTRRNEGLFGPLILILFGIVFLLERNGVIDRHMIWQLLPLMPIAIGSVLLVTRVSNRQG